MLVKRTVEYDELTETQFIGDSRNYHRKSGKYVVWLLFGLVPVFYQGRWSGYDGGCASRKRRSDQSTVGKTR